MYAASRFGKSHTDALVVQEKHGNSSHKRKRDDEDESASDESTSESEDEGDLATATLDSEIMATINAIRSKDPRVYDNTSTFYTEANQESGSVDAKKEKPMNLQDYHRQNLLNGNPDAETEPQPLTYSQEQERMKESILGEINAAAADSESEQDEKSGEKSFLVAKRREKSVRTRATLDIESADKDPETFLSNFMVSRAWAAPDPSTLHPFESDDDEEERRADEYEEAWNLRFEDPAKSNEKLRSHARDFAAKYSVRREEANPRQKKRDAEKANKEAEKQQRKEEKARLRKLKIEEFEEKVRRIKRAAGIRTQDIQPEDWSKFVDEDWDDAKWEEEMQRRFGEDYYADEDIESEEDETSGKKRKVRKPKFDDDIDIKDIVPDFEDDEKAEFTLTDEEDDKPAKKAKKDKKKLKDDKKRDARRERRIIEQLVDDQLQMELDNSIPSNSNSRSGFLYRETSPKTFGLSASDILLADDKQLNEFAGLKKLASFRDQEKKRKDAKNLGKKGRLRKWRLETFGNEAGLTAGQLIPKFTEDKDEVENEDGVGNVDIKTKGKKKRRRNKDKKQKIEGENGTEMAA